MAQDRSPSPVSSTSNVAIQPEPRGSRLLQHPALSLAGTHHWTADAHNLTSVRTAIGNEMDNEILLCDVNTFQRSYLPFVPKDDEIEKCVSEMLKEKENKVLSQGRGNELQWTRFKELPSQSSDVEKKVYAPVTEMAQALTGIRLWKDDDDTKYKVPRIEYRDCPYNHIASEVTGANFKNDSCFHLGDNSDLLAPSGVLATHNIVAVVEYKKNAVDKVNNRLQVVSAASCIMNDDPRRMFIFGLTIEDTMASLWYFDRSHTTKSVEFDFIKNPKLLISVFISLLFAHETGLGYDPAIRRHTRDSGRIYYEYRVGSRFYRTLEAVSSYRSLAIAARMTRVWRAVEIPQFGGVPTIQREVALKDVWLDAGAETEIDIQEHIFQAIDKDMAAYNQNEPSRLKLLEEWNKATYKKVKVDMEGKKYRNYFATIEQDEKGEVTKSVPETAVPTRGLFLKTTSQSRSYQLSGADPSRSHGDPTRPPANPLAMYNGTTPAPMITTPPPTTQLARQTYQQKVRHIVVSTEVGKALHDITNLQKLFRGLKHALRALIYLFIAKWVHRDISTGNILVVDDGDNVSGRLIGLEYARPYGAHSVSTNPKTGTPFFLAFELLEGIPLTLVNLSGTSDWRSEKEQLCSAFDDNPRPGQSPPTSAVAAPRIELAMEYDYEHDGESVWWIVPWSLTARIKHPPGQQYAAKVFINKMENSPERTKLFLFANCYFSQKMEEVLCGELHCFIPPMVKCVTALRGACYRKEKQNPSYYLAVYTVLAEFLGACENLSVREGLPPLECLHAQQPVISTKPPTERKRKRGSPMAHDDIQEPVAPHPKRLRPQQ